MGNYPTNSEFAKNDTTFNAACDRANVKPTRRQASKFRAKTGKAYRASR